MANSKVEGQAAVGAVTRTAARGGRSTDGGMTVRFDPRSVWRSTVMVLLLVAGFLLALWLFSVTRHFLFLVLLAWMFAIALEPGIKWLIAHGRSRGVATAIMGGSVILLSVLLAAIFGKLFFSQISSFVSNIPSIEASLIKWVNARFGTHLDVSSIATSLHLSSSDVGTWAGKLSGGLLGVVGSLSSVLFDLITVVVFGFYIAGGGPSFMRTLAAGMPPRAQRVFVNVAEITIDKTGGYVVSKIILATLSSLFHGIFFLAIGVPYWLPFALLVGITAQFVPLIGTYIGVALPVLATVFGSPWRALAIILFAIVYQQIESYVFTPRVSHKTMDINPAIALAAVFLGVAIWGPIGAIIGIPLVAAGASIFDAYTKSYDLVPEVVDMVDEEPGETDTPEPAGSSALEDEDAGG